MLVEAWLLEGEDEEPVASAFTYAGPEQEHGWFALHVPPGSYRLTFSRFDMHDAEIASVIVVADQVHDVGAVKLAARQGILIRVFDSVFAGSMEGVEVALAGPEGFSKSAVLDSDGRVYFDELAGAGEYTVVASKDGYIAAEETVTYSGSFLELSLGLEPDLTCTPTTVNDSLTNMGFEDELVGWTQGFAREGVEVVGADEFTQPWEGDHMARLGHTYDSDATNQPEGPNLLCQDFVASRDNEAFSFNIFTYDYTGFDEFHFDVAVIEPDSGEVLASYTQGAWAEGTDLKTSGWRTATVDTSAHIGETLRFVVRSGGTEDDLYGFWTYLDSAEDAAPPVNLDVSADTATGSVNQDPVTGQFTVTFPTAEPSDLTLTFPAVCTDESIQPEVTVLYDGVPYPALGDGDGLFQATIPKTAIAASVTGGVISTQVECVGQTTLVTTLGQIVLYDPSGFVTDAATGEPVKGAEVLLHKVPGWTPNEEGTLEPGTCETNESKAAGAPWGQPAPVHLGVPVSAASPEIDPNVNPQLTNASGYYGWDVAKGCWYVTVRADGYLDLVSPVVGVPSAVTDLDLALVPVPVIPPPTPGGGGGGGGTPATAPVNTAKPTITGTAKVGETLTATPGTWNTEGLTFGYQWLRDGEAIAGATGTTYVATAEDSTHGLSVRVTASKTGLPNGTADSTAVTVAAGDAPVASAPPAITGDPEVGETLTASEGTWDLTGLTFGFQWERDGEPIAGATSSTYQVVEADRGSELTVVVTASKPGYADGTATSDGVDVPEGEEPPVDPEPVATTTTVSLVDRVVRLPQRGVVKVRVVREDGEAAVGRIAVKVNGKVVAERKVREAADGQVRVKLPKLKRGVHKVRVVFTGGEGVESSTSDRVLLKVRPAKRHGGPKGGGQLVDIPTSKELLAMLWG
ncbi:hypothetical protein [Nocardioides ferulae]|uniref:hypothetical protein n=1 Tax=Nocardioides ferulae TaxID=2340821 RepID=UPI000F862203|nr:hypothetical protein [Nocardioides ferulae]